MAPPVPMTEQEFKNLLVGEWRMLISEVGCTPTYQATLVISLVNNGIVSHILFHTKLYNSCRIF